MEIWFEPRAHELCSGASDLATLEGQEEVNWLIWPSNFEGSNTPWEDP
jgi:hypothetical protein